MPTLHVALDESGDFTFNNYASRYYVFAATWTYDPAPVALSLTNLRFSLLKQGHNIVAFHATEDKQANRDAVMGVLNLHANWHFAAVVVEKAKVNPALRDPYRFYPKFATMVLRFIFRRHLQPDTDRVVIFTDSLPVKKRKESVEKAIKKACRDELGGHIPFASYHHPRASNSWIQASDYCSWAVYRKWHHGDARSYHQLRTRLAEPELDVLARGTTRYY